MARVSGARLIIGAIIMGLVLPVVLFLLLHQTTASQLLTIAASTFLSWGVSDLFATILEKPRLKGRTPGGAIREDWERRKSSEPESSGEHS